MCIKNIRLNIKKDNYTLYEIFVVDFYCFHDILIGSNFGCWCIGSFCLSNNSAFFKALSIYSSFNILPTKNEPSCCPNFPFSIFSNTPKNLNKMGILISFFIIRL